MELIYAKTARITKLIIECDATEAVKLLFSNSPTNRLFNPILNECKGSLRAFQEVKIQHCFRKANKAVDLLPPSYLLFYLCLSP